VNHTVYGIESDPGFSTNGIILLENQCLLILDAFENGISTGALKKGRK
jgi:hypothetical protein